MGSAESRLHREADAIAELSDDLRQGDFERTPVTMLCDALVAIACRLGSGKLVSERGQQIATPLHNHAIGLFNEGDAPFYVANVMPQPLPASYLLLRGLKLWTAPCHGEEQIAITKAFGLAYITLGLRIQSEPGGVTLIDSLARDVLPNDMELREYVPEIERHLRRRRP